MHNRQVQSNWYMLNMEIKEIREVKELTDKLGTTVTFSINSLSDEENKKWEIKFNSVLNDCGCNSGKKYLFFIMPFILLLLMLIIIFTSISKFQIILIFFLSIFLVGTLGKINGLKNRKQMLKDTIEEFFKINIIS